MLVQNKHHLTIDHHNRTDLERIEDIGADAIAALRNALEQLDALDARCTPQERELRAELHDLFFAGGALTAPAFRLLRALIAALGDQGRGRDPHIFAPATEALWRALSRAERVDDLLAAERHVAQCRTR